MNTGKISARYAKALYSFAEENKHEEEVYNDIKTLYSNFEATRKLEGTPSLHDILENPTTPKNKKKGVVITAAGTNVCAEFDRFIDLVIEHKREDYLQSICLVFQDMYRKKKNIITSKLVTAVEVSKAEEERMRKIVKSVTDGDIEFEKVIDPNIIGGFVLNVETYQVDASIKSQLRSIKGSLLNRNAKEVQ